MHFQQLVTADPLLHTAIVALCVCIAVVNLGAMIARRLFLFVALFFLLFTFMVRLLSLAYIDLAGPVYAEQLAREIGPGLATPWYLLAYLVFLLPIVLLFSDTVVSKISPPPPLPSGQRFAVTLADAIFWLGVVVVVVLYADMLRRGVIPLFAGLERFEYTANHAGPLHVLLTTHGFFFVFLLGFGFAHGWVREGTADFRFVGLFVAIVIYLFMAGNRFSAFYAFSSFFLLPIAGALMHRRFLAPTLRADRLLRDRVRLVAAGVGVGGLLAALIIVALANSYLNVRSADDPVFKLTQRVLVQPAELGWFVHEQIFVLGEWDQEAAVHDVFVAPFDASRNTGIQHLMVLASGRERAYAVLEQRSQYTGGFPEIMFAMFGPVLAWPVLLVLGVVVGSLLLIVLRAVVEGHVLTAFFGCFVVFGPMLLVVGGMMNFMIAWTYWAKVTLLLVSLALERSWRRRGFEFVPWVLLQRWPQWLRATARRRSPALPSKQSAAGTLPIASAAAFDARGPSR